MASQYRLNKSGLQAQLEAGVTFKKSVAKSEGDLEFVPVNLHVQELKVTLEGSDNKGTYAASVWPSPSVVQLFRDVSLSSRQGDLYCSDSWMPHCIQSEVSTRRLSKDASIFSTCNY